MENPGIGVYLVAGAIMGVTMFLLAFASAIILDKTTGSTVNWHEATFHGIKAFVMAAFASLCAYAIVATL